MATFSSGGAAFSLARRGDAPTIWTESYVWYGRVEVELQTAPGAGVVTSAVMLADDGDEIDWEWSGNDFGRPQPTLQTNYYGRGVTGSWDRGTQPRVAANLSAGFHTYALDWAADTLRWELDGAVLRTLERKDCRGPDHPYPQTPARLFLGLWDGGDPDEEPGTVLWAGGYTDLSRMPYTAYVTVETCPSGENTGSNDSDTLETAIIASTTPPHVVIPAHHPDTAAPTTTMQTPLTTQPGNQTIEVPLLILNPISRSSPSLTSSCPTDASPSSPPLTGQKDSGNRTTSGPGMNTHSTAMTPPLPPSAGPFHGDNTAAASERIPAHASKQRSDSDAPPHPLGFSRGLFVIYGFALLVILRSVSVSLQTGHRINC